MIKKIPFLAFLLFVFVLPVSAIVVEGSIYTATVSKYLWRGSVLNNGPAIQSGVSFGSEGVTLSLWTSCQQMISPDLFDEIDLYANYEHSIPNADFLTLGVGYASYMAAPYNYPFIVPSQEVSLTIKSDIISSPYITWYHLLNAATTYNYLEAGVSYEYEIGNFFGGKTAAGAAATIGLDLTEPKFDNTTFKTIRTLDFTVATFNIYYKYAISDFTITPSVLCQLALNKENYYQNYMAGSLMVNYDFSMGAE